ncbi:neuronal acetylcholine receptor subunit alpha-2-like [Malaya genurostris]|uniref:neuronal acetylcholine receptor subunit alpha-2-like n=1 Tax=Malaya genurostris TaxID=325434 RepID=UPI0026F3B4CD|nr:neuronal acetylcholine receptor subunit alpha-2-like [Malaya genurostris]
MPNGGWLFELVALVVTLGVICYPTVVGVSGGSTKQFVCDDGYNGNNTELVLKNALLCGTGYNARQRPVKNQQDRVAMYIGADVMSVELVSNSNNKLELTVELSMQWFDIYLHWNKKEHGNINTLSLSEQDIWTPTVAAKSLLKSRVQSSNHCFQVKCHLSSNGEVIYTMLCTFEVDCLDNTHSWAFETRNCPLRIFTPGYNINQLSLFHFQRRLSYSVFGVYPYKITSFQMAIVNNTVTPEFRMDVVVERIVGPHLVIFLTMILLLMAVNLVITWFGIDAPCRGVMTFASLALHLMYTTILYWYSMTRMEPALKLANVLLGSSLITVLLVALLAYSEKMSKRDSSEVPRFLKTLYGTLSRNATLQPFLQLEYINLTKPKIKSTTENVEAHLTNHVTDVDPLPAAMASSKDTLEQNDSDEEVDLTNVKWSVFVQPFDRAIFCGIATTYVVMLVVLFLV